MLIRMCNPTLQLINSCRDVEWVLIQERKLMNVTTSFKVIESRFIPALQGTLTRAKHIRNGAEFIHLICSNELENSFAACFRTPCADDLGIPHMIEHIILQGSEKYPVKDLYIELERRSMASFAYGNTASNRTVYLCGSNNAKQYMKLVSVYMNAVFHPLLSEEIFQQEAYRLDFQNPEDTGSNLIHNGVVYNEMKGIAHDQREYVVRKSRSELYPDVSWGKNSAGEYRSIPDISYKKLVEYYNDHYHPSNCCLFSITGIPFAEMAELLNTELAGFDSSKPPVRLLKQTPFEKTLSINSPMPGRDEGNCIAQNTWIVPTYGDIVTNLACSILKDILYVHNNSPLKTILIQSKLGTSLFSNYAQGFMQNDLSIGLYGVDRAECKKVFPLIKHALKLIVKKGLNQKMIHDVINQEELKRKEKGDYWSESTLWKVCAAWANNEDVTFLMDSNSLFSALRQRLSDNPCLFQEMISRYLLNNPNRLEGIFYPDEEYFRNINVEIREDLRKLKKSMSDNEIADIVASSKKLIKYLEEPVSNLDMAKLPVPAFSEIADLYPPALFPNEEMVENKLILSTEINTSDICYVDLCFDVSELPFGRVPHLAFFEDYLIRSGAGDLTYPEALASELSCSSRVNSSTLSVSSSISSSEEYRIVFRISGHCLPQDLSAMLSAMERRVFQPELNKPERILAVAREMEEQRRGNVIYWGNKLSMLMAKAGLSTGNYADNLLHGIPSLQNASLINMKTVENTIEAFTAIQRYVSEQAPQILVWSGPEKEHSIAAVWYAGLPGSQKKLKHHSPPALPSIPTVTGIETQSTSSSICMAVRSIPPNHPLAASGVVAMEMVDEFLINEIMLKGGAYTGGGYMEDGALLFYSYRDPSPARSLSLFHEVTGNCIDHIDSHVGNLEPYILSALKKVNPVLRPATANTVALKRFLKGETANFSKMWNSALLSVKKDSVAEFCTHIGRIAASPCICVISNKDTLGAMDINDRIYI